MLNPHTSTGYGHGRPSHRASWDGRLRNVGGRARHVRLRNVRLRARHVRLRDVRLRARHRRLLEVRLRTRMQVGRAPSCRRPTVRLGCERIVCCPSVWGSGGKRPRGRGSGRNCPSVGGGGGRCPRLRPAVWHPCVIASAVLPWVIPHAVLRKAQCCDGSCGQGRQYFVMDTPAARWRQLASILITQLNGHPLSSPTEKVGCA